MKNEKNYMGFLITKIWQILKRFSRALKVERKNLISEECLRQVLGVEYSILEKGCAKEGVGLIRRYFLGNVAIISTPTQSVLPVVVSIIWLVFAAATHSRLNTEKKCNVG